MLDLFKWRVVDRFQPFVSSGTSPMHYVLDITGSVALAYEDGLDPNQLGYRHEDAIGIAHSLRLAHTVGVNGFFTTLSSPQTPRLRKLTTATGITTPVLVWLANALSQLDRPTLVPVSTSTADVAAVARENNPAATRWLPVFGPPLRQTCRLRLVELAQLWPHVDTPPAQPSLLP